MSMYFGSILSYEKFDVSKTEETYHITCIHFEGSHVKL